MRSPVTETLAEAKSNFPNFDVQCVQTLIDARERDLKYPNFSTLASLSSFAADTQAPLIQALSSILVGEKLDTYRRLAAETSRYAGEAIGLAVLLRGAPAHAANKQSYVPNELVQEVKVNQRALLSGTGKAAQVFSAVADRAERALALADDAARDLPHEIRPALWGLQLPRMYLRKLRRCGNNPFDEGLQRSMRYTYPLRLQVATLARRIFRR